MPDGIVSDIGAVSSGACGYIAAADFRTATVAEYCANLTLSTAEASNANLDDAICRWSKVLKDLTNDDFSSASVTYNLDGMGARRLFLPRRSTAVTTVKTKDYAGTQTTQASTVYRFVSSLDATGAVALGDYDYIEIIPGQELSQVAGNRGWTPAWEWRRRNETWPEGPQNVEVVGTFGWTITPSDVKRAVALLVFDHFKPSNPNLRRAERWATGDVSYSAATTEPTGIPEVDEVIERRRRPTIAVL